MASDAALDLIINLKDNASKPLGAIAKSGGFLKDALSFAAGGILQKGIEGVSSAVTGFFQDAIGESQGWNKAFAQTEAVIKSTGGAAGLSAQQMADLASSLSGANGVSMASDDAILAGENLLATFTNIGEKTFPKATAIMVDMAQAMGTDVKGGAIQLGKALNDPIAGIGALSRVGVTFSDEQKEVIRNMMAVGDTAGAQAVILNELTKEFGGSAAAAAKADGGMFQLGEQMANVKQTIGDALLPILQQLVGFIASPAVMGTIQGLADLVAQGLTGAFEFLKGVFEAIAPTAQFLGGQIGDLLTVVWQMITTGESVGDEWGRFTPLFMGIAGTIADFITTAQQFAIVIGQAFGGEMKLDALQALPGFLQPVAQFIGTIVENIGEFVRAIQSGTDPFTALGELIKNNFLDLLPQVGPLLGGIAGAIGDALPGILAKLAEWAGAFLAWIGPLIPPFLAQLAQWAGAGLAWLGEQIPVWLGKLAELGAALWQWISPMIGPALEQLGQWAGALLDWFGQQLPVWTGKLAEWGGALVGWIGEAIPQALAAIGDWAGQLFDWIGSPGFQLFLLKMMLWRDALFAWIENAAGSTLKAIGDWAGQLFAWIGSPGFTLFLAEWAKWGAAAAQWIADSVGPMLGQIVAWAGQLLGWLVTTGLPQLIGTLAGWAVKLIGWIIDSIPGLIENLGIWAGQLWTWITGIFTSTGTTNMNQAGTDIIQGLIDGIGSMAQSVMDGIGQIWTNLSSSFTQAAGIGSPSTVFKGFGMDLLQGLINGIAAMTGSVLSTIHDLAMQIPEPIRTALGIKSPSTVFYGIGLDTGAGLINGLTASTPGLTSAVGTWGTTLTSGLTGLIPQVQAAGQGLLDGLLTPFLSGKSLTDGGQGGDNPFGRRGGSPIDSIVGGFTSLLKPDGGVGQGGGGGGQGGGGGALAPITDAVKTTLQDLASQVQWQALPSNEGSIAYWWGGAKGLIPYLEHLVDQGSNSLKAYMGPAWKGVFDYIGAEWNIEMPALEKQWHDWLHALILAAQQAAAEIAKIMGGIPTLPGGGEGGNGQTQGQQGQQGGGQGGGGGGPFKKDAAIFGGGGSPSGEAATFVPGAPGSAGGFLGGKGLTIWVLVPGLPPMQGQATTSASEALRWQQDLGRL